eukprot:951482-Rhodomonas_salina.2
MKGVALAAASAKGTKLQNRSRNPDKARQHSRLVRPRSQAAHALPCSVSLALALVCGAVVRALSLRARAACALAREDTLGPGCLPCLCCRPTVPHLTLHLLSRHASPASFVQLEP